ncbi:hypothetical protein ACZ87_03322 [Candidatus Erwinia dacicola]|uniref:Uncharacterized protein n=1 Tax=Candidatus Erwinia dacicola TaxID=252393 RepID=A0A328TKE3_9GAMM|nr:hypothetical protein ACZ87_03322 [Candidatus Erwinia dacicola]
MTLALKGATFVAISYNCAAPPAIYDTLINVGALITLFPMVYLTIMIRLPWC